MRDSLDDNQQDSSDAESAGYPKMPANAWTVLGMLTFGDGLSGYDLKTWADWSLNYFYWSPSFSQVYSELKKLEGLGLVRSELDPETEARGRRVYHITDSGLAALRAWSREAPVDASMLKHPTMVRIWLGHLNEPALLKQMVRDHISYAESMRDGAALHAEQMATEPTWGFAQLALRWSQRYYQAERDLAVQLLEDIDEATATFESGPKQPDTGLPAPIDPARWKSYRHDSETFD